MLWAFVLLVWNSCLFWGFVVLLFHVAIRLNYLFWGTRESFVSLVLVKRSLFLLVMVSWWLLLRLKNWKLSFPPFKKEN